MAFGFAAGQGVFSRSSPAPVAQLTSSPRPTGHSGPTATSSRGPGVQTSAPAATPEPTPTPTATPPVLTEADVPLVPVVSFWSGATSISRDRIVQALSGADPTYKQVVVLSGTGDAVDRALGIARGGAGGPTEMHWDALVQAVGSGALGLVPLPAVTPTVRALALDGVSLFGHERVNSLDQWPLFVHALTPAVAWDQAQTWTLAAGGDLMFDRGVAYLVSDLGKGVDYLWDGGTVAITGHHCCTTHGYPQVETRRTGNAGMVRDLFSGVDIAMANLEGPAPDDFTYHEHSLTFTFDPKMLVGLDNAGFDMVSLANNHISNDGVGGLRDTIRNLDELGMSHAGAGADLDAASAPAYFDVGDGTRVAVVSCSDVGGFRAGDDKAGMLHCSTPDMLAAISEANANADVVVVFPHWGVEYRFRPTGSQRSLAAQWAAAGVDVVLGSHPHVAEAIEEIDGTLVFYSMGNLVFDQDWSEMTLEGLVPELTFERDRLVQAWPHPTLILNEAQPNLLDYAAGGSTVLDQVRQAAEGLFPY